MSETKQKPKHTRRRTLADDFGSGRLNVENMDSNYHYYVENDENGKVEKLKARGYEPVHHGEGVTMGDANPTEVGSVITTTVNKEGVKAILLKAPIEFREEDEKFLQDEISEAEKALFRNAENEKGRYGEIKTE